MRYIGSKRRIADEILPIMLDNEQALLMLRNNRLKPARYKLCETIAIDGLDK